MTTICKQDIITSLSNTTGQTKVVVEGFLVALAEKLAAELVSGNEVILTGIGKFKPVTRAARSAWNVSTGGLTQYPERKAVKFSITKHLKDAVEA